MNQEQYLKMASWATSLNEGTEKPLEVTEVTDKFAEWRKAFAEFNKAAQRLSMIWMKTDPTDEKFGKEYRDVFEQSFDEVAYDISSLNDAAQKVKE